MLTLLATIFGVFASSCAGTPFAVSGGFFGASVTVDFPNGIGAVPVKTSDIISKPTLLVPQGSPISAQMDSATVTAPDSSKVEVPVVEAPVQEPTLAVPK